jgi:uncharacterized protein (DUF58 family)
VGLTRNGVALLVAASVLLASGVAARYPELIELAVAAGVAPVIAVLWLRTRSTVDVSRVVQPERVEEGGRAHAVLTVANPGRRRTPPLVVTESVGGRALPDLPLPSLGGGERATFVYDLPVGRRNIYSVPAPVVARTDPLRLLRAGRPSGESRTVYVHPIVHPVAAMPAGGPRELEGRPALTSPPGGDTFSSLREYVAGDDWRLIHWRSSARVGELVVRHNVMPVEPQHLVVLDTRADRYTDESFEDAVRVAASLCHAAAQAGYPTELRTTAGDVVAAEPLSARAGRGSLEALDLLAGIKRSGEAADLLSTIGDSDAAALALVTGRPDADQASALSAVRTRFPTICLIRLAERFPYAGGADSDGIIVVNATSSQRFAAVWNAMVER